MIKAIARDGTEAGKIAAAWWQQEAIGGHSTGDVTAVAANVMAGLDDGDPETMDSLPSANLSGEWADDPTVASIYGDHASASMPEFDTLEDWRVTEIGDVWEEAFNRAVHDAVYVACQAEAN